MKITGAHRRAKTKARLVVFFCFKSWGLASPSFFCTAIGYRPLASYPPGCPCSHMESVNPFFAFLPLVSGPAL